MFPEIQAEAQPGSGTRPCGCEISGSAPRRVGYRGRRAVDERAALGGCCVGVWTRGVACPACVLAIRFSDDWKLDPFWYYGAN